MGAETRLRTAGQSRAHYLIVLALFLVSCATNTNATCELVCDNCERVEFRCADSQDVEHIELDKVGAIIQ